MTGTTEVDRQPYEIHIAIISVIGLVVLLPLSVSLCTIWFSVFWFLFIFWAMLGLSSITSTDRKCINIGFRYNLRELYEDFSKTKYEIIILVIPVRLALIIVEDYLFPSASSTLPTTDLFALLVLGPLAEEFYFRGIVQERMSWIMKEKYAIILTSVIFSFYHWIPGTPLDITLLTRFIRSLFYGVIYAKTRNILASSVAHFGVNLWGVLP